MPVIVPAVMPVVPVVIMAVPFNDNHLIDVGHRREGVDRLRSLGAGGTETGHSYGGASEGEEFTHMDIQ